MYIDISKISFQGDYHFVLDGVKMSYTAEISKSDLEAMIIEYHQKQEKSHKIVPETHKGGMDETKRIHEQLESIDSGNP